MYNDKLQEYSHDKKSQPEDYAHSPPSYDEASSSVPASVGVYQGTSRGMNGGYHDENTSFNTTTRPRNPHAPQSQSYDFPGPYGQSNLGSSSSDRYATHDSPRQPASYFSPTNISPSYDTTSATSYPGFTYTGRAPSRREPFNPPPLSFSRTPPPASRDTPYTILPMQIRIPSAKPSDLTSGFLPIFPTPHLLLAHDVQPADISRLLEDCHIIGKLSMTDQIVSGVVPAVMGMAPITGFLVGEVMKGGMGKKKVQGVRRLVEAWDEAFFRTRGLRVWVEQGSSVSGVSGRGYDSESSDSESESGDGQRRARYQETGYARQSDGMESMGVGFGRSGSSGGLGGMLAMGDRHRKGGIVRGLIAEVMKSSSPMSPTSNIDNREYKRDTRGERRMERRSIRGDRRARKKEKRRDKRTEKNESKGSLYLVISNA